MLHVQKTVPKWKDCLYLLPNGASVKATGGYEMFAEVKAINPTLFTIHRMVRGEWQIYSGDLQSGWFDWETAKNLARQWFNGFVDGTFVEKVAPYCDAVSWHNEEWADSQPQIQRNERIAATEAAVWVWNKEYRTRFSNDIQLIIGEAAPGNGMPRRIAQVAIDSGNIVGYHPYEWWNRKVRSDWDWRYHTSLRFDLMEDIWGLYPEWAFTEAGPLESAVTGWRASECLGGDEDLLIEAVRLWIRDVMGTNAGRTNRIRGFNLFTTFSPNDKKWGTFHLEQPQLNRLATMVSQEWKPGSATPPQPDPTPNPPNSDFKQKAWDVTSNMQIEGDGGLRLNKKAAIQSVINEHNISGLNLQIVTDEVAVDGFVVQAAESLTDVVPRRVYVWEAGSPVWFYDKVS